MLINDFDKIDTEIIIEIAKNIKTLNIVTNHIDDCKKTEEYLYSEFGIILNISNNKRKSLLNSKIILNLDFPEELVNKYRIYEKSIIINISGKIKIFSKRFSGININYYKIKIPEKYKINNFKDEIVYESTILETDDFKDIASKIKKDKIKIKKLIGNNGIINEKEII